MRIYTDGSHHEGVFGWGWVAVDGNGSVVAERSGHELHIDHDGARNVAAEISAVVDALSWCRENGVRGVTIVHDYEGLSAWPEGRWAARKDLTREYVRIVRSSGVDVVWVWVRGHSGDAHNDRADRLASDARKSCYH